MWKHPQLGRSSPTGEVLCIIWRHDCGTSGHLQSGCSASTTKACTAASSPMPGSLPSDQRHSGCCTESLGSRQRVLCFQVYPGPEGHQRAIGGICLRAEACQLPKLRGALLGGAWKGVLQLSAACREPLPWPASAALLIELTKQKYVGC